MSKEEELLSAMRTIELFAAEIVTQLTGTAWCATDRQSARVRAKLIQTTAASAIEHATPTKSPDADEIEPDNTKCPGCGYIWSTENIAYFEAKQSQDPPYACADCRENERQQWDRETQT